MFLKTKINFQRNCLLFLLVLFLTGCETHKFPGGVYSYGFGFKIDWDVFEYGTYSFTTQKNAKIRNTGRSGMEIVNPLILDVTLKNGENFQEVIDIPKLLDEFAANTTLPDLRKTEFGGSTRLEIHIGHNLKLTYLIRTRTENPALTDRQYYILLEKEWSNSNE